MLKVNNLRQKENVLFSPWRSFVPSIGGSSGDPTKSTNASVIDVGFWRREGDSIRVRYSYAAPGTNTASLGGTGRYIFRVPTGLLIDLNKINPAGISISQNRYVVGQGVASFSATQFHGPCHIEDTTGVTLSVQNSATNTYVSSNFISITACGAAYSVEFIVPILGWGNY